MAAISSGNILKAYQQRNMPLIEQCVQFHSYVEDIDNGDTQLHLACRYKLPAIVQKLLAKRPSVDGIIPLFSRLNLSVYARNDDGETALWIASKKGYKGIVRQLIEAGSNLNIQDNRGDTPLHGAVFARKPKLVRLLLVKGARHDLCNRAGLRPLDSAMVTNNLACALILIEGRSPLFPYAEKEELPDLTILTARFDELRAQSELLKVIKRENIKEAKEKLKTIVQAPLPQLREQLSAALGYVTTHKKLSKLIKPLRLDLDCIDRQTKGLFFARFLPYLSRCSNPFPMRGALEASLAEQVIQDLTPWVGMAAERGNYPFLKIALKHFQEDVSRFLPLALGSRSIPCALLLLNAGAESEGLEPQEMGPVLRLMYEKRPQLALEIGQPLPLFPKILPKLNAFAKLEACLATEADLGTPFEGTALLHQACQWLTRGFGPSPFAEKKIAEKILARGAAHQHFRDHRGRTPLHWALAKNQRLFIGSLLEKLENPHVADNEGQSLLHVACRFATLEDVKSLKEKGADMNALNGQGNTPLHEALDGENPRPSKKEIALYLIQNDAQVDIPNLEGATPIVLAAENREEEVAVTLFERIQDPRLAERKTRCGRTLFESACEMELYRLAFLLLPQVDGEKIERLFLAELHHNASTPEERLLLLKIAKPPAEMQVYLSPLHRALKEGDDAAALAYINSGQYIEEKDHRERTALLLACAYAKDYLVQRLIEKTKKKAPKDLKDLLGKNPLHHVFSQRASFDISCLMALDVSFAERDMFGSKPLEIGTQLHSLHLVSCDANPHSKLHGAQRKSLCNYNPEGLLNHLLKVEWPNPFFQEDMRLFKPACLHSRQLLAMMRSIYPTASFYSPDAFDLSSLYMQISNGHYEITQFLFELGVLHPKQQESTLLMRFWRSPHILQRLEMFTRLGINLFRIDPQGNAPLHWACQYPHNHKVVRSLLERGENPHLLNKAGETALDIAEKHHANNLLIQALKEL